VDGFDSTNGATASSQQPLHSLRPRIEVLTLAVVGVVAGLVPATAALAASQPKLTLGAAVAACVFVLAFRMPVANLTLLVFLTTIVPYGVLNRFSIGGGIDSPGLLPSDLFLVAGLAWAVLAVTNLPLDRRRLVFALAMLGFLVLVAAEFMRGYKAGYGGSVVGQEARVLLCAGTFLMALPLLLHRPSRGRLIGALGVLALALGAWGMVQWFGHFSFGLAGDVGVRTGVAQTSGGGGQLQGGEFAYPVAIVLCFAVFVLGDVRSRFWRSLLVVALALNVASCLVTFERSFWLDAVAGLLFLLVTAPGARRVKALIVLAGAAVASVLVLSAVAPSTLTTASQRLNSISGYGSDPSVRYRVVESQFVLERIHAHPVTGSGLGASIFWGQPWAQTTPKSKHYSHDGYLWLAWKMGVPAAALLVALLLAATLSRRAPREEAESLVLRRGAQGAIVGLLLATITFPSFSQLGIMAVIGLLLALAVSPQLSQPRQAG
jgi:O-antigen ligase